MCISTDYKALRCLHYFYSFTSAATSNDNVEVKNSMGHFEWVGKTVLTHQPWTCLI